MKYPHPVFGWQAPKLADLSFEQINELRLAVVADPASANPAHKAGKSIYLYTKSAMKKLDALAWAVFYKKQEASRGN